MPIHLTILIFLLCLCALTVAAAEPQVSNRAPQPGEWGYRPADGETVRMNPPSLCWVHEAEAQSYTVQWARREDFSDAVTANGFRWNTYTHHAPLTVGTYFWRYRFTSKKGETSNWSVVRKFTVPADAIEFPMPTRAQQRERVPKGRPRLFMRPEDLPRLRELAKGRLAEQFNELRAEADRLIAGSPTPEPEHLGSIRDKENKELVKYWWPNRVQTEKACKEAETIAFVYLMTGEKKYGEAARRWVLHLASWNPDGPTNFSLNCEAAKPMLFRLPRAYDWAYDALTPEDRQKVQQVMKRRALDAWKSGEVREGVGHLNRPYSSHGNRTFHKLGECAIAFLGEIPEAEEWLDYAVNKFYAAYPVWSDDDGGWHEGVSYWAGYQSKVVWWLQVSKSALGIDGFKKPFFAQVGDFPLYVAPPHSPNMGFGDMSHGRPSKGWGGFLEFFLRSSNSNHRPYWRWWTQQWKMGDEGGWLDFLYEANLPPLPEAKPPTDLPPSKVFRGVGIASLHTTLLDSSDDVHFLFKSSPFGSQSHGHNPQNSFQLNAYGEALLTTCVYRDLHGSKFHYGWAHSTVAHNAVLVNGEGQVKHTAAVGGQIVDFQLTPSFDYVVGDATDAYGERLTRYRRHVAFVKPDVIVLYDDLAAKEPATFQFMLHALKPFTVDNQNMRLSVEQPKAGVVAQYLSPLPLTFRQWDGYEPKPDYEREFPNQWHVEASTQEKRQSIGVLTVIIPYRIRSEARSKAECRQDATPLRFVADYERWTAERLESDTAIGARIQRGGKTILVAFRKAGVTGKATLAGVGFEGAVEIAQ